MYVDGIGFWEEDEGPSEEDRQRIRTERRNAIIRECHPDGGPVTKEAVYYASKTALLEEKIKRRKEIEDEGRVGSIITGLSVGIIGCAFMGPAGIGAGLTAYKAVDSLAKANAKDYFDKD